MCSIALCPKGRKINNKNLLDEKADLQMKLSVEHYQ